MVTITIADLVKDDRISSGFRVKKSGQFASKQQIEIWKGFMDFKEEVEQIRETEPDRIPRALDLEIDELEEQYNDDMYNEPHEHFKIKFPDWQQKDEQQLKKIVGQYFYTDKSKRNVKAMKYTLTKLKIEKMRSRIK